MKAKALETCAVEGANRDPLWRKDQDLVAFLASLWLINLAEIMWRVSEAFFYRNKD